MKNSLEQQAKGYQDLIDEVEKDQIKIIEELKYVLTGVIGGRELSDQEYQCRFSKQLSLNFDSF